MNRLKIILILVLLSSGLFGGSKIQTVLMSKVVQKPYDADVYKKTIVLMTEARLYLQKKYKKKIIFEYDDNTLFTKKKDIVNELKKKNARFYVYLEIVKKKAKKNLQKVFYNLKIFDKKSKRLKTVKTKAIIRDLKIVKISQGDLKSSAKKIAKILKKR